MVLFLWAVAVADHLPLAEPCVENQCILPNCKCSSTDIPGGLQPRDTPQVRQISINLLVDIGIFIHNIHHRC